MAHYYPTKNTFATTLAYASVIQKDSDLQNDRENTRAQPRANSIISMREASDSDSINL